MRRNYWRHVILLVFDNSKYFMKKCNLHTADGGKLWLKVTIKQQS